MLSLRSAERPARHTASAGRPASAPQELITSGRDDRPRPAAPVAPQQRPDDRVDHMDQPQDDQRPTQLPPDHSSTSTTSARHSAHSMSSGTGSTSTSGVGPKTQPDT